MAIAILAWNGAARTCGAFSSTVITVTGLTGGDTIAVQGSLDNSVFTTIAGSNMADDIAASGMSTEISANGIYTYPATGYVKYVKTGSASTPTVNLLMKR